MKTAICVGINNYPGTANDLNGCINDANDWASLLNSFGFKTSLLIDGQATKDNIINSFKTLITGATEGDVVVFTYSGHGTQVMDTNGDEQDGYDEALYVYDAPIIDDDLRAILDNANKKAHIVIITDSCFSGTVTKAARVESAKVRFYKTDNIPSTAYLKKSFLSKANSEDMVEILLSGCSDKEYSYDAQINGKWNGAMTAYSIPLIKPGQTYNELYSLLRTKLPSTDYPQTPQLEGSETNKNNIIFDASQSPLTSNPNTNAQGPNTEVTGTTVTNTSNTDSTVTNQNTTDTESSENSGCLPVVISILAATSFITILLLLIK